jgi:hypothetical protein
MNVHDFLLLIGSVFELLHEQIHHGRQHVYLLELMHTSTSLVGLKTFFIPTLLEAIFSMRAAAPRIVSDKKAPPAAASMFSLVMLVNPW